MMRYEWLTGSRRLTPGANEGTNLACGGSNSVELSSDCSRACLARQKSNANSRAWYEVSHDNIDDDTLQGRTNFSQTEEDAVNDLSKWFSIRISARFLNEKSYCECTDMWDQSSNRELERNMDP